MGGDSKTDIALVEDLKRGGVAREQAMKELHQRHHGHVKAALAFFSFDHDTLNDLLKDTFIRALRGMTRDGAATRTRKDAYQPDLLF